MVGFIIPLKPKFTSSNWNEDSRLLKDTLRSILNQSASDFKAYVVYSDLPEFPLEESRIIYLKCPYPFLSYDEIPNHDIELRWHKNKRLLEKRLDKSKKIMYGCQKAIEKGCQYLMSIDSDDLISSRIVDYINKNNREGKTAGWYINRGYVLNKNSRLGVKNHYMQSFNGSTHILRHDLVKIPDFNNAGYVDYSLFTAHGWTLNRIEEQYKVKLEPLNFYGVIYIVHKTNISKIKSIHQSLSIKNLVKRIVRLKIVTKEMKREFGMDYQD